MYAYGNKLSPSVGNGLGGLPSRVVATQCGFTPAKTLNKQHSYVAGNMTLSFTPKDFRTVGYRVSYDDQGTTGSSMTSEMFFASNDGSNYYSGNQASDASSYEGFTAFTLSGNTFTRGYYSLWNGKWHIIATEYNMKVKNSDIITAPASSGLLPFTITDINKVYVMCYTSGLTNGNNQFGGFANMYSPIIPVCGAGGVPARLFYLTDANNYAISGAFAAQYKIHIIEFE